MGILNSRLAYAVGGLACVGCSSLKVGTGYREVAGEYLMYDVDTVLPFVRVQGEKEIAENLKGYGRFDFVCGEINAHPEILRGKVGGSFGSVGAGARYYLTDEFSLDAGGEIFFADIDLKYRGRVGADVYDTVFGAGLNLGGTFERKIADNAYIFFSGGYNLTTSATEKCSTNFDGFYSVVGLEIRF